MRPVRSSRLCGGRPFGVDILVHGSDGGVMKQLIDIFAEGKALDPVEPTPANVKAIGARRKSTDE